MKKNLLMIIIILLLSSGCMRPYASVPESTNCPKPGTKVSFSKLTTPSVAEDYVGCDVKTVAQFVATGAGAYMLPSATEGKIVFRVLPVGVKGEKNPLSGEIQANFVAIPKEDGSLVFELNPGDKVLLSGGTYVQKLNAFTKMMTGIGDDVTIVFMADKIERVK